MYSNANVLFKVSFVDGLSKIERIVLKDKKKNQKQQQEWWYYLQHLKYKHPISICFINLLWIQSTSKFTKSIWKCSSRWTRECKISSLLANRPLYTSSTTAARSGTTLSTRAHYFWWTFLTRWRTPSTGSSYCWTRRSCRISKWIFQPN